MAKMRINGTVQVDDIEVKMADGTYRSLVEVIGKVDQMWNQSNCDGTHGGGQLISPL